MSLVKEEYQALLTVLNRVEIKGLQEARSLVILEQKIQARIANWFDGHVTGFKQDAPQEPTPVVPPVNS